MCAVREVLRSEVRLATTMARESEFCARRAVHLTNDAGMRRCVVNAPARVANHSAPAQARARCVNDGRSIAYTAAHASIEVIERDRSMTNESRD
jgi:hypothetical protein